MTGIYQFDKTGNFLPWLEFAEATPTPAPGCYDFVLCEEYFTRRAPFPLVYTPSPELTEWLEVTGITHEFHASCVRQEVANSQNVRETFFEDVAYFIRFFDQTNASAYRLMFV